MKRFLPLKFAFGRDLVARDIADSFGGLAWSAQTVQRVLAMLQHLHLAYHGPRLNLQPIGGVPLPRSAPAPKPMRVLSHK